MARGRAQSLARFFPTELISSIILEQYRHAALFVDSILKGAKPGDLPVRQATKFRLAINLNTAKALHLEVPQSLLVRADDVFE